MGFRGSPFEWWMVPKGCPMCGHIRGMMTGMTRGSDTCFTVSEARSWNLLEPFAAFAPRVHEKDPGHPPKKLVGVAFELSPSRTRFLSSRDCTQIVAIHIT